jgi:hypothetical protein
MSSMLDQAIVDAQALREAALKNAEQAVIDKYAPEIKAAVESILEGNDNEILTEQESPAQEASAGGGYDLPYASDPGAGGEEPVEMSMEFEFNPEDFSLDLQDLKTAAEEQPDSAGDEKEDTDSLVGSLGLESPDEGGGIKPADDAGDLDLGALQESYEENDDALLEELMSLLDEDEDQIDEALKVDTGEVKHGHFVTDAGTRHYDAELEAAAQQSAEYKEKADSLQKQIEDLQSTILTYQTTQDKLHGTIADMKGKIEEALVMNARLLYSNRILSDASLNERQKTKIVEAVAKATTIEQAKTIAETLKETIAGSVKKGPKSLSESVNRKSNLSHVLPRRKQQELNETLDFASRMKLLAGIDKN